MWWLVSKGRNGVDDDDDDDDDVMFSLPPFPPL